MNGKEVTVKKRYLILLCVICFGAGFGLDRLYVRHQLAERAKERKAKFAASTKDVLAKQEAKRWDPLPPPPLPAYGAPLAVPELPPPPPPGFPQVIDGVLAVDSALERALKERFLAVVKSNPDADMVDLVAKIASDKLHVRFAPAQLLPPNALAIFRLWPMDRNIAAKDKPLDQYRPEIVVNMDFMLFMREAEGWRAFQVVVVHEYQHYRQYEKETDERLQRTFIPAPGVIGDEPTCAFFWDNELDAYSHSSRKAVQWGVRDDLSSRISDPRAFAQFVFMAVPPIGECLPVWAARAGHPHPEAFKP